MLLQPFREGEFGRGAAGPSKAHLAEVNALLIRMGRLVDDSGRRMAAAVTANTLHVALAIPEDEAEQRAGAP